jgi:prepilin-type processing-associated H-X9-DG protein
MNGGILQNPTGASLSFMVPLIGSPASRLASTVAGMQGYTMKQATVAAPATTAWVADGGGSYLFTIWPGWQPLQIQTAANMRWLGVPGSGPTYAWPERHLETTNVLWTDGHVKAVKLDELQKSTTIQVHYGALNTTLRVTSVLTVADD